MNSGARGARRGIVDVAKQLRPRLTGPMTPPSQPLPTRGAAAGPSGTGPQPARSTP